MARPRSNLADLGRCPQAAPGLGAGLVLDAAARFGYRNVEVVGADGERSHVEREIIEDEARVVRRIFELCARGSGQTNIAKTLNAEGAPAPTPKRKGAPAGWAPSSVRSVLYRDLYRGVMVWNRTKKRDRWGQQNRSARPEDEHIEVPVPDCRIVSDDAWNAAHEALRSRSKAYLRHQDGKLWGRPPVGVESAYLLVGLAACGYCGGGLEVKSSSNGRGRPRSKFYCCSTYGRRGKAACKHRLKIPMEAADAAVLESIEDALDDFTVVRAARKMLRAMREEKTAAPDLKEKLQAKLAECEKAIANLTTAIAAGGNVPELAAAVKAQNEQRGRLEARLADLATPEPDEELTFAEVKATAQEWREILTRDTLHARQILKKVLATKLRFKEQTRGETEGFTFRATGSIVKLVSGVVPIRQDSHALVSPTGFEPVLPA